MKLIFEPFVAVVAVWLACSVPAFGVNNGNIPVNTPDSARRMIDDLIRTHGDGYADGSDYLRRLDAIGAKLKRDRNDREAAQELAALIRQASLANPILDFDKILVIRRKGEANRGLNSHTTADISPTGKDNDIAVLSNLRGEVKARPLYRHPGQGSSSTSTCTGRAGGSCSPASVRTADGWCWTWMPTAGISGN